MCVLLLVLIAFHYINPYGPFDFISRMSASYEDTESKPTPIPLASQIALLNNDWKEDLWDEAKESYFDWFVEKQWNKQSKAKKQGIDYDAEETIERWGRALWPEEKGDKDLVDQEELTRKVMRYVSVLEHEEWSEEEFGNAAERQSVVG